MIRTPVARAALVAAVAAVAASARAGLPLLTVPGEGTPAAVTALGPLEGIQAFGVSGDGSVALAARPSVRSAGRSVLRIGRADGSTAELELPGAAPALVVASAGDVAFVVVRETDKKGAIRRVALVRVDPVTAQVNSQVVLPPTARGLAFGAGEGSLLVSANDELRSFLLPGLTSGPLYRVAGANGPVAPLTGTTRVVVAQGARLAVVDLAATQDRDGLPLASAAEAPAAVRTLASSPDEPVALALLEDGRVFIVEVEPLRLVARASAVAIAWPGVAAPVPSVEPIADPPPTPTPPPPPPPPPAAAGTAPEPEPRPMTQPVPPPPADGTLGEPGTVGGIVSGPARGLVKEVVLFGPDNILQEAARVVPDGSGRYSARGLRTGSYRIVAAGGDGRVLACNPPYVTVKVSSGADLEAPAIDVLRVR